MASRDAWRSAMVAILFIVACTGSFFAGRATAPQRLQQYTPPPASSTVVNAPVLAPTDDELGAQLAALQKELSVCGWDLIGPIKEFESGRIDTAALVQRTAEPEMRSLRLCTRMHELANQIASTQAKEVVTKMTMGLLQRHRGLSMIIEGYAKHDDARVAAGTRLFEDGRILVLKSSVELGGSNSTRASGLQRVLESYEEASKSTNSIP